MLPTTKQFEAIKTFFESKELDPKCYICGAGDWAVEEIIASADPDGPKILRRGMTIPLVQLECRSCGHVVFFNAHTLGL